MITRKYQEISPAYGRDYKSQAEAKSAFLSGVDFKMESLGGGYGGTYCSVRDFASKIPVVVYYKAMSRSMVVQTP